MEERVQFHVGESAISGVLHIPEAATGPRPAVLVLHGFGSRKDAANVVGPVGMFLDWGYVVLRYDMRGCGESDGTPGHVPAENQVEDTIAALAFMQARPEVDPERILLVGSSFGGAVAIYAAAVDSRATAVISSGGWGNGERKFRQQHPEPAAWSAFTDMLERGERHRKETGESLFVDRHAIVPIPPHLRQNLAAGSAQVFSAETAMSMYRFEPESRVADIAPRPLLLLHSSDDSVTPTGESIHLFQAAGQPTDLYLIADTDHFMMAEGNRRVIRLIKDWLDRYFPPPEIENG